MYVIFDYFSRNPVSVQALDLCHRLGLHETHAHTATIPVPWSGASSAKSATKMLL